MFNIVLLPGGVGGVCGSARQALAPSGESLLPAGTLFAGATAGEATGASRIPRRMLMPKERREERWTKSWMDLSRLTNILTMIQF